MADPPTTPSLGTRAIHADDVLTSAAPTTDVAPAIHISTIFHYPRDPSKLISAAEHRSAQTNEVAAPPPPSPLSHAF